MKFQVLGLLLSLALLGSSDLSLSSPEDPAGLRFRCEKLLGDQVCLDVLSPGCSLQVSSTKKPQEVVLPPQGHEEMILSCSGSSWKVESRDDLVGHVEIDTASDALEYLRFSSSLWTVHLFREKQMEIFLGEDDDCLASCLPLERWKALDLRATVVEPLEERGFRVTRNVVRPIPSPLEVSAFRITEVVLQDGTIQTGSEERLVLELEDQARLTFPLYP